jgi:hypothetical protein
MNESSYSRIRNGLSDEGIFLIETLADHGGVRRKVLCTG